jgi:hypothetical protein
MALAYTLLFVVPLNSKGPQGGPSDQLGCRIQAVAYTQDASWLYLESQNGEGPVAPALRLKFCGSLEVDLNTHACVFVSLGSLEARCLGSSTSNTHACVLLY